MMKIAKLSAVSALAYLETGAAFTQTSEAVRSGAKDDDLTSGGFNPWCILTLWLAKGCGPKPPQPPKPPPKEGVCSKGSSRRGSKNYWTKGELIDWRNPPIENSRRGYDNDVQCYNCLLKKFGYKYNLKRGTALERFGTALELCGADFDVHDDYESDRVQKNLITPQDPHACNNLKKPNQWPKDKDCARCLNNTGAAGTKTAKDPNGTETCGTASGADKCNNNESKKIGRACGSKVELNKDPPINSKNPPKPPSDKKSCQATQGRWRSGRIVNWRNPDFVKDPKGCVKCIQDRVKTFNNANALLDAAVSCGADKDIWDKNLSDAKKQGLIAFQDPHACEYYKDPAGKHAWCQDNPCIKCVNNNALAGTATALNPNGRPACDSSDKNPFDLPKCNVRALKNAVDACGGNAIRSWPDNQDFSNKYPLPTFDKKKDKCPKKI